MRNEHFLTFFILTLIGASPFLTVHAQPEDKVRQRTEMLLETAFKAMRKANETIEAGQTAGLNQSILDEASAHYLNGTEFLELANATFHGIEPAPHGDWGNYTRAIQLAVMAMHSLRRSIATIMEHWEETGLAAGWRGLSGAIERAENFVARAEALVEKARESHPDYNFTLVEGKLSEARQHLEHARGNLTALNQNATAREIGRVRPILNQITAELKKMGHSPSFKGRKIATFVDRPLRRLIDKVQELADELGENITEQMGEVDSKIEEAKSLAAEGDQEGAMEKVKEAHSLLRDLMKELHRAKGRGHGQGRGNEH
ncbi:MAG: hypothetical protein ACE5Z5_02360 [Candidatus Bathyarchaeia archaeon]